MKGAPLKRSQLLLAAIVTLAPILVFCLCAYLHEGLRGKATRTIDRISARIQSNYVLPLQAGSVEEYASLRSQIQDDRRRLAEISVAQAGAGLEDRLEELISFWYGTDWEWSGTTETPRQGSIACGYFVSTLLKHLGYQHNRVRLAQAPSASLVNTFCEPGSIRWISDRAAAPLLAYLNDQGEGWYIIGLDKHTGFIHHAGEELYFIHSVRSVYFDGVTREPVESSRMLRLSKVKMVGKLFGPQGVNGYLGS